MIQGLARSLFRRQVEGRAHGSALPQFEHCVNQPEVGHQHLPSLCQHVITRRDIRMHHAIRTDIAWSATEFLANANDLTFIEQLYANRFGEIETVHKIHD